MSAPLVVGSGSSSSVAAGWTFSDYWRPIADQIGNLGILTLTSTASASVNPDATALITISAIATDGWSEDRLDGYWLHVTNGAEAGEVRRVLAGSYDGVDGSAKLDRPFTNPLESGVEIELTDSFPAKRYGTTKGGLEIVNEALRLTTLEFFLELTGSGSRNVDLTDYGTYLDQGARVDSVWDRWSGATTEPYEPVPYPVRVDMSGGQMTLVTERSYGSDETFRLRVLRDGHTLIKSGGSWGSSSVGFTRTTATASSPAQAAAVPVQWVKAYGLVEGFRSLMRRVRNDATLDRAERRARLEDLAVERQRWVRAANRIGLHQFPTPTIAPPQGVAGIAVGLPGTVPGIFR